MYSGGGNGKELTLLASLLAGSPAGSAGWPRGHRMDVIISVGVGGLGMGSMSGSEEGHSPGQGTWMVVVVREVL